MRIQHNIPAMNAYRNYNTNTKALQGNLQKLSSGYKINKAGDDAAGLAISEKMRAQITGLEVAQKNAKDGISLVQTAEGALTEVHTMLNRMYSLAEQSANGTYADDVDREQLQKEVVSLRDEIDRIADATNFNGKKLLDGSLAGKGGSSSSGAVTTSLMTTTAAAVKGKYSTDVLTASGTTLNTTADKISFTFSDENGQEKVVDFTITAGKDANGNANAKSISVNGEYITDVATDNTIADTEWGDILKAAFKKFAPEISDNFDITFDSTNKKMIFENKEAGTGQMQLKSYSQEVDGTAQAATVSVTTKAADSFEYIDTKNIKQWDGSADTLDSSIFEVNGEKFVVTKNLALTDAHKKMLADAGVGNNVQKAAGTTPTANEVQSLVTLINQATGIAAENGKLANNAYSTSATDGTLLAFKPSSTQSGGAKGGLTLQIGDTADKYNKMTVTVKDCHAKAIGIGSVDISKQGGAASAMTAIKNAINNVSDVRGTLGALQNRLDHTINNLSVQQENIQDAEATIRDVDVANEMMAYTKNNILVQSAQAMLAQANQLPQGVLQLLG